MKSSFRLFLVALLAVVFIVACAPSPNPSSGLPSGQNGVAGFWLGLWQGFIAPIVFVVSLFKHNVGIYEVHNNGTWYNLGYLFGMCCFFGGGGHGSKRKR